MSTSSKNSTLSVSTMFQSFLGGTNQQVEWLSLKTIQTAGKKFTIVEYKNGNILSSQLALLIDQNDCAEAEKFESDYWLFCLADNWYYCSCDNAFNPEFNLFTNLTKYTPTINLEFAHLGIHSSFEIKNSTISIKEVVKKAKYFNTKILACADKHSLASSLPFQLECSKAGIKSVVAETFTVNFSNQQCDIKLYVINNNGWTSLLNLNNLINNHKQPMIEAEQLQYFACKGVICVLPNDFRFNDEILESLKTTFYNVYFQVSFTKWSSQSRDDNYIENLQNYISHWSKKIDPVLIDDCYYIESQHSEVRKVTNASANINNHTSTNQNFKSIDMIWTELCEIIDPQQIKIVSRFFKKAVSNTIILSNECHFQIDINSLHLPTYEMTAQENELYEGDLELMFRDLIQKGLIERNRADDVHAERAELEYHIIKDAGFISYFLTLYDVCKWSDNVGILRGLGRGSAAGSLIAYLLRITHVCPTDFDLFFERFLNKGRLGKKVPSNQIIIEIEGLFDSLILWEDDWVMIEEQGQLKQIRANELQSHHNFIGW